MNKSSQALYDLCLQRPFDPEAIAACIRDNGLDSEAVTHTALLLCDRFDGCYDDFCRQHHRAPAPEELPTYRWEELFDLLADHGLDVMLTVPPEDAHESTRLFDLADDQEGDGFLATLLEMGTENTLLMALSFLDDGDLGARIARNLLRRGGSPNVPFEDSTLFRVQNLNFGLSVLCSMFEDKRTLDREFAFWLMLVGFGGVDEQGVCPLTMYHGRTPELFREFEKYSYCYTHRVHDFTLYIYEKDTGLVVATME